YFQISDLHISKYKDLKRGPDLVHLCKTHLSVIKPEIVITSGDLVDAKYPDHVSSTQFAEEWTAYKEVVELCEEFLKPTKWLDIRGNHDAFDVPDLEHPHNYYREYSKQGKHSKMSYSYTHNKNYGKYRFIGVDACPDPGPRRPFNFFGQLNTDRQSDLIKLAQEDTPSNLTIWFGHYPTSIIVQDPPGIKHIMRKGIAYLCGHLHTLNGMVPSMYTKQKTGMLELELGDWRDNRMYRVLAIDNDILSFIDAKLTDWPVILLTNPKHALFQTPSHEPVHLIKSSTHIRFLVFSEGDIVSATVYIDNINLGSGSHISGPLYTLPWDTSKYITGLHNIKIIVQDSLGNENEITQPFSLDGSHPDFKIISRLILMTNISFLVCRFYRLTSLYTFFCGLVKYYDNHYIFITGESYLCVLCNKWLFKLWLTSRTNFTYYSHILFLLYVTFGPWFVGDLLVDHVGCVFVWGIFLKNTFIPGSVTYFYGLFQIITFNIPLLLITSHILDIRSKLRSRTITQSYLKIPFIILLIFQSLLTFKEFPSAYGTKALVIGPVRTGSIIFAIYTYYYSNKVSVQDGRTQSCTVSYS
ncbi:hypothetical protein LOTGIDRAFT_127392, partial [Lottia gigantea]